ncbi:MAG: L-seryl-tRNA(Sec) selenium transferase [Gemmatimonadetes bacterium]|nr:L-seryl-tRNA(Sec) selenium transferase [Gemmatimonadota bacterium]
MTDARPALPAVHKLLAEVEERGLTHDAPREVIVQAIRETIDIARSSDGATPDGGWAQAASRRIREKQKPSLVPVVNATGVILHTNLGRAPLPDVAREAIARTAGYATLEYDLATGERGSRQAHLRTLLREVTGAEDALVVTNAAAAMVLILNAVAAGGETIVSRGELVEIGGAFRIPDILEKSGSALIEVGTTNRTRLRDYVAALSPRTRCALKVHRSNFRLSGFVTEVEIPELVEAMEPRRVHVIHDIGSGLLLDLSSHGLTGEPLVQPSIEAGATVVFSGDKLLGGPQAGIIAGPAAVIAQAATNPFTRAMRPGKTVVAALEATLALYRDRPTAMAKIPTLAMATADPDTLRAQAAELAARIPGATTQPGTSSVGGGSFPDAVLPTTLVAVPAEHPETLLSALRAQEPAVVARAGEGRVLFDPRTLQAGDGDHLVRATAAARQMAGETG